MNTSEEQGKHVGRRLLAWEVDEYMRHDRSRMWYILASVLGAGLIIYAIATANFLFAVIILMIGIILLIGTFTHPERIDVILTTTGVVVGDMYYEYKDIRDFSIVYEPPEAKWLYLDFFSVTRPLLAVPLDDIDPNVVREALLPFLIEELDRNEERLTEVVQRLYKL